MRNPRSATSVRWILRFIGLLGKVVDEEGRGVLVVAGGLKECLCQGWGPLRLPGASLLPRMNGGGTLSTEAAEQWSGWVG